MNRTRRRAVVAIAGLAAAIIFLVTLTGRWPATDPPIAPHSLGTDELSCDSPRGSGADFSVFRWSQAADGGTYSVTVYDAETGDILRGGESGPLQGLFEWSPDPAVTEEWPAAIEWELRWDHAALGRRESVYAAAGR